MSKRSGDLNLEYIANKLRKLEKQVKHSRNKNRLSLTSSSSSNSSKSSSSSANSSRRSSRAPTPVPQEDPNTLEPKENPNLILDTIDLVSIADNTQLNEITPEANPSATAEPSAQTESSLDLEILIILGDDPSLTIEYGPDINKELATRFNHIATSGLGNNDARKELVKKYLVPANCPNISAPLLNAEIKAAVSEQVIKRDRAIEVRQKQIAAGISGLSKIISEELSAERKNLKLIKDLMDVGKIFCDIQHSETEARRNFCLYSLRKELQDQLSSTKVDKYLFGDNLAETVKTAKAVTKSGSDLKFAVLRKSKKSSSTSNKDLNWKARAPAWRQPPGPTPRFQLPTVRSAPPPPPPPSPYRRGAPSMNYLQRPGPSHRP